MDAWMDGRADGWMEGRKEGQRSSLCVRKWSQANKLCFCEVGLKNAGNTREHHGTPIVWFWWVSSKYASTALFAEFFPCSRISISFSGGVFILRSLGFHLKPTNTGGKPVTWGSPLTKIYRCSFSSIFFVCSVILNLNRIGQIWPSTLWPDLARCGVVLRQLRNRGQNQRCWDDTLMIHHKWWFGRCFCPKTLSHCGTEGLRPSFRFPSLQWRFPTQVLGHWLIGHSDDSMLEMGWNHQASLVLLVLLNTFFAPP